MLTQCPNCLTLFRVGPEHLRAADGQVRCSLCHQVFNALESLQESPSPFIDAPLGETESDSEPLPENEPPISSEPEASDWPGDAESHDWLIAQEEASLVDFKPMLPDQEPEEESREVLEDILEQDDGLEPAPDYLDIGTESQMSELLDQDSSSLLLPDSEPLTPGADEEIHDAESAKIVSITGPPAPQPAEDEQATEEPGPMETADFEDSILKDEAIDEELGKPDYDSVPAMREEEADTEPAAEDDRALRFEAEDSPRPQERQHRLWLIGSLLLLLPLSGQLAWQFRHSLIQHETGRQTLNLVCAVAGCQVPVRRNLERIVITGRNLSTHPDKPDILQLQLSLVNTAPFDQPYPQLALSLFNDNGNLIARRTFSTDQYLPEEHSRRQLMPKAQPVLVQMDLVDPGNEVTGFSFDFY